MQEKRSETKLAIGSVAALMVALLPAVGVGLKAVLDAGLVASGTWAYVAVVAGIAAVGAMVTYITKNYVQQRTQLKIAQFGTIDPHGKDPGSIRTPVPGATQE